jgi:hypothetical protein
MPKNNFKISNLNSFLGIAGPSTSAAVEEMLLPPNDLDIHEERILQYKIERRSSLQAQKESSPSLITPCDSIKCWACWESTNSQRNPLIRVCQGCKVPLYTINFRIQSYNTSTKNVSILT